MRPDLRYARNGDTAIAYQVVGEGRLDLLVVLGYLSNIEYIWRIPSASAFLERLASSSRLILMDRRGSGLSDRFGARDAPPLETLMDDLEAVLDAAGSARAALLGVWDGCAHAMVFAASHPDRVSWLVLFSSAPAGSKKDDFPWSWGEAEWQELLTRVNEGWGTRAEIVREARWQSPSVLQDPEETEEWITYTRVSASPASAEAVLRVYKDTDIRHVLPAVRVPTLVLHRRDDQTESIEAGRYVASKIPGARFVELPGRDAAPWIGDAESVLVEIERFLTADVRDTSSGRVLSTVLFTDIVGSTERAAELGDAGWKELLAAHEERARAEIERHRGSYVDSTGDGLLATFDGPARAVRCARALSEAIRPLGLEIRAGCHTGEVELAGTHVRGIAVHIGARVAALAGPGELLVSSTVRDLTAGSGLVFEDAGEHELKGVPDRWRLYRVVE